MPPPPPHMKRLLERKIGVFLPVWRASERGTKRRTKVARIYSSTSQSVQNETYEKAAMPRELSALRITFSKFACLTCLFCSSLDYAPRSLPDVERLNFEMGDVRRNLKHSRPICYLNVRPLTDRLTWQMCLGILPRSEM